MHTCLLFLPASLELSSSLSLVIDEAGEVQAPLEQRSLDAFLELQKNTITYVVLPAEHVSIYHLELPALPDKKAKTAIEFALEPTIPQPLQQVHLTYSYEKESNTYQVIVITQGLLRKLINELEQLNIQYKGVIVDATLLQLNEAFFDQLRFVIHTKQYHGAVLSSFEPAYKDCFPDLTCYTHVTLSDSFMEWMKIEHIDEPVQVWLASRLIKQKPLNLCQGDFSIQSQSFPEKNYRLIAGVLGAGWILSYLIASAFMIYQNQRQIDLVNQQVEQIYKQFFPQAKQVVNPRFRVEQLIKKGQGNASSFWKLISTLTRQPVELENLFYRNQALIIHFKMKQFSELQAFQKKLAQTGIQVKQTEARQQGPVIEATLELKA